MNFFITALWENPFFFFSWVLFIVFSICCHEYMHAKIALIEGDDTAAMNGHLTLNPIKQMGIFSLFMLALIGICWGSVPVNPANFRRKSSDLIVSLAGPFTNLFLAIVFFGINFWIWHIAQSADEDIEILNKAWLMFYYGTVMNLILFFFNMLPVPGFDGWAIVRNFVSADKIRNSEFIKGASIVVLLLAIHFMDNIYQFADAIINFCYYILT
ncbi:MAG: site-2 protease family protein [Lentisphaeria bacterium]|nr:site-2 protease family protein [Lentisphaeria bacterium]